jgi:Lipocalin-like domain
MNVASRRKLFLNVFLVGFFLLAVVTGLAIHARATSPKAPTPARENSIRAQLIGSWRLVSRETHSANGELLVDPRLSATPVGFLVYDASGHVAAQLSRRGRTVEMLAEECKIAASTKSTPNTAQTILGYDAYFGTFTLHEQEGFVTHHLECALFPADIGKDINRNFKLSGDRLTLSFDTTTQKGAPITRTLIWERLK